MIVFAAFCTLLLLTALDPRARALALSRSRDDWWIDSTGLLVQGALVPLFQTTLVYLLFSIFLPSLKGTLVLHPALAFALNFAGVDCLFYWNHRLLHSAGLWPVHAVHHTADRMDLLVTSRNTLWTPLLMAYLWVNGFMIFWLKDPFWFVLAASLTAALDLWRHTTFGPASGSALHRLLSGFLITPHEHAWHHSSDEYGVNFGANLNVWDRLHGTFKSSQSAPRALGSPLKLSLNERLLFPFQTRQESHRTGQAP